MKLRLTIALLTTLGTLTAHSARSSDNMATVTITAHRPDTIAAKNAANVLSLAEEAMNRYFVRNVLSSRISDLWVFPSNDLSSVFVQYELRDVTGQNSRRQLAVIELHGYQITRIVDLTGTPATRAASAASGG
jgi:hypothetical protein